MATILTVPVSSEKAQGAEWGLEQRFGAAAVTGLTVVALAIAGYHPYAEDGGLYLAGVKKLLRPELYPSGSEFVTEHLRFSAFAPMVAGLVRGLHLDVMTVMLALHIVSFWLTLFAAWQLAARCYRSREARLGAVALLAVWLTIPIAGTSLMLMDPYVSARSFSTPCALLALVGMLDFLTDVRTERMSRWWGLSVCSGALGVAALIHPLMAAYALGGVLLLVCMLAERRTVRVAGTICLCVVAIFAAAILLRTAPGESADYLRVALTREYWFVARWQWYEQFGLAAPLVILGVVGLERQGGDRAAENSLARVGVVGGVVAVVVAMVFARAELATHLVARLQPLRMFQMVYVVMILVIGAALGERILQRRVGRWMMMFLLLGGVMLYAERQTFPGSAHIELPGLAPQNGWEQAFVWISRNTPADAVFAMDARYISKPGEDAQSFRAIAERSALADYSKDGGEAAITPDLTGDWMRGQVAQAGLDEEPDGARVVALRPLGVSWVVLPQGQETAFSCAYENADVKVCRLPQQEQTVQVRGLVQTRASSPTM